MLCPKCPNEQMMSMHLGPVDLDTCRNCGGMWYDANEMRLLKDRESLGDYRWMDVDLWRHAEQFHARDARFKCPRDGEAIYSLLYGDSDVPVDVCAKCKGMWLDRPEYQRIINYLDATLLSQSLKDYMADVAEEFAEIFTGPEGIFEEYKDFDRVLYFLQLRFAVNHPGLVSAANRIQRTLP